MCVRTRTHQYKQKEVWCVHNNSILQICSSFFPTPSACYTLLAMLRLAELCGMPSCATMDVFFSPVFEICVAQCDREQSKFSKLMWSCCSRCSGMSYFNTVWVRCAVMPKKAWTCSKNTLKGFHFQLKPESHMGLIQANHKECFPNITNYHDQGLFYAKKTDDAKSSCFVWNMSVLEWISCGFMHTYVLNWVKVSLVHGTVITEGGALQMCLHTE